MCLRQRWGGGEGSGGWGEGISQWPAAHPAWGAAAPLGQAHPSRKRLDSRHLRCPPGHGQPQGSYSPEAQGPIQNHPAFQREDRPVAK